MAADRSFAARAVISAAKLHPSEFEELPRKLKMAAFCGGLEGMLQDGWQPPGDLLGPMTAAKPAVTETVTGTDEAAASSGSGHESEAASRQHAEASTSGSVPEDLSVGVLLLTHLL